MSLYNGFSTHQQQQKYYTLVRYLVLVLEKRLVRFYQDEPCNQKKFISILSKLRTRITKLENNKYSQPKFADSLAGFLRQLRSQDKLKQTNFGSMQSRSMLSNNDVKSQLSLDFSFDRLPTMTKMHSLPRENQSFYRLQRKNYRSFESMKTTPVINQSEEWQHNQTQRLSKVRASQLSHFQFKLQPPKLVSYIDKIKKQTKMLEMMSKKSRKQSTGQVGQLYIGQRRKRNKKILRTYEVQ